jgi:hypothetical protein
MLDEMENTIKVVPSEEDIAKVLKLDNNTFQKKLDEISVVRQEITVMKDKLRNYENPGDITMMPKEIQTAISQVSTFFRELSTNDQALIERELKGKILIQEVRGIKTVVDAYNLALKNIDTKRKDIDRINDDMDTLADNKEKIIKTAKLPEGVVILSESDFTVNGFDFSKEDISESEAWMILAEIIIKRFPNPYMRMGNASVYNMENLNKLALLASKHGKIIALERVVDNLKDVRVMGMIADGVSSTEITVESNTSTMSAESLPESSSEPTEEPQTDDGYSSMDKPKDAPKATKEINPETDIRRIDDDDF